MLFTKSKTYIYIYIAGLKRISQVSSLFVCVFHIVPYRHRIKRISGNCVLPVFGPTSDQNQIYKKIRLVNFFLKKLCLWLLPDLPKALYSPAGPTPMTKFRLFCQTRIFPFLRNAPSFSIDVKSSRYPLQKREEHYLCLVRNKKTFEPFLESKSIS